MTNTEKIIEIVRNAKKPLTGHEIAVAGGFTNEAAALATISSLVSSNRLTRVNDRPYRYTPANAAPKAGTPARPDSARPSGSQPGRATGHAIPDSRPRPADSRPATAAARKSDGNPAVEYLNRRGEVLLEELNGMLKRVEVIRAELNALDSAVTALS